MCEDEHEIWHKERIAEEDLLVRRHNTTIIVGLAIAVVVLLGFAVGISI